MQKHTANSHSHQFDEGNPLAHKKILFATILTAVMIVLEVLGGWIFQSMALLADGWHMGSHVVADAVTSVLAIIVLFAGKYMGWDFLDAVLGLVGSVLIARWAIGLLKQSAKTLLDADMDVPVVEEIREVIAEYGSDLHLTDLHVSRVGKGKFSCFVAVQTGIPISADQIREAISIHEEIVHISVEINQH